MRGMARRDSRSLRDEATTAASEGKHRKALECYLELERIEPAEPNWSKRVAETYRRLGRNREAIAAYDRAAERYVQNGFLVQAIAVCKVILQIDPGNEQTKHRLLTISEQQDSGRSQAGALADRHRSLHGVPAVDAMREAPAGTSPPPLRSEPALVVAELPPDDAGELELEPTAHGAARPAPVTPRRPTTPPGVYRPAPPEPPAAADELDLDDALAYEAVASGRAYESSSDKRKPVSGPILLDRGAPLDSVPLAPAIPGAQPERSSDGATSGIIVIPIDDDTLLDADGEVPALELEAVTVPRDVEVSPEVQLEPTEEPVELAVEDLEEVPDLAEPRAYSAAAQRALMATPLFAGLPPAALEHVIDRMALVELADGDVLFRQGDPGDALFVVAEGGVIVVSEGPPRQELSRFGPGAFFGEVALITEEPRSATIVADGPTQLMALDREILRALVREFPDVLPVILRFLRDRLVDRLVKTHPLFASFAEADRAYLVSHFRFLEIEAGSVVLREGGRPAGLYALLAGKIDVAAGNARIASLRPGDLFGEGALLTGAPSPFTFTAAARCLALCLPAPDFREIIMTHPQVLSYVGDLADERQRMLGSRVHMV